MNLLRGIKQEGSYITFHCRELSSWLPQATMVDYLARFWQKNYYVEKSDKKMVILQTLPEKWLSCKILAKTTKFVPVELRFDCCTLSIFFKIVF